MLTSTPKMTLRCSVHHITLCGYSKYEPICNDGKSVLCGSFYRNVTRQRHPNHLICQCLLLMFGHFRCLGNHNSTLTILVNTETWERTWRVCSLDLNNKMNNRKPRLTRSLHSCSILKHVNLVSNVTSRELIWFQHSLISVLSVFICLDMV